MDKTQGNDPTATGAWIFQGNPAWYDISRAVTEQDLLVWGVKQCSRQIARGDRVYIWASGPEGGVIARGVTLDDPSPRLLLADQYTLDSSRSQTGVGVEIRITDRCADRPFSRSMMLADRRLSGNSILTFPNATNYKLTPEQAGLLDRYFEGTYSNTAPAEEYQKAEALEAALPQLRCWLYAPGDNACMWDEFYTQGIMGMGWDAIGDFNRYGSKNAVREAMRRNIDPSKSYRNDGHAVWQFVRDMQPGDVVFVKKGLHRIIGRGVVESDYYWAGDRSEYRSCRKVRWTHKGEWDYPSGSGPRKTLTEITPYTELVRLLNGLFEENEDGGESRDIRTFPEYSREDFLKEVFLDENAYDELADLIRLKKNVILQGPPGVGKTFAARRLAYSLMNEINPDRVMVVQFHQSYSYEDFMLGYRPDGTGFSLAQGPFYRFCKDAEEDSDDTPYFFIIDEINRGNLSKIFGELLMLIEGDKRGQSLRPLYSDELFSVPKNVYIIGTMNTADRSLAIIDYALRRRFAFYEMTPALDCPGFLQKLEAADNGKLKRLVETVKELNQDISGDDALGKGFCIGHSYFCPQGPADDRWVESVVKYELIPLLEEYWFDAPSKARQWSERLKGAVHD